ncbi:hypothetical protein ZWY2020_047008 [Hordeum vulgare]|nr:hypothetical protein ZWY2020_047008 [Hordeum vulgare]
MDCSSTAYRRPREETYADCGKRNEQSNPGTDLTPVTHRRLTTATTEAAVSARELIAGAGGRPAVRSGQVRGPNLSAAACWRVKCFS